MDNNTKAKKMAAALEAVSDETRFRGDPNAADLLMKMRGELPVGSLARLFDMIKASDTKADALRTMGADA